MWYFIILSPIFIVLLSLSVVYLIKRYKRSRNIILLSKLDMTAIVNQQNKLNSTVEKETLAAKLIQAGITLKEYNEARLIFAVIGIVIMGVLPFFTPIYIGILSVLLGVLCIVFGGKIYIAIAKAERTEKIDRDLGVFLDLVNVILEAGGSLKNAFFTVSKRADKIIDEELLKEVAILEYEMTNYSTKQAYENLKNRVDSEQMGKIVDFLILSEETGIGVKNIFTTQSNEMRQDKFYKIKGKVGTLNLYLMVVIFIFILPAVAAFVVFPMKSGAIATGF